MVTKEDSISQVEWDFRKAIAPALICPRCGEYGRNLFVADTVRSTDRYLIWAVVIAQMRSPDLPARCLDHLSSLERALGKDDTAVVDLARSFVTAAAALADASGDPPCPTGEEDVGGE